MFCNDATDRNEWFTKLSCWESVYDELRYLSFAEFVVSGHKSNRTSKATNQNPFKGILMAF